MTERVQDLCGCLDNLERRILSLNYDGDFGRTLFLELKHELGLEFGLGILPLARSDASLNNVDFQHFGMLPEELEEGLGFKAEVAQESFLSAVRQFRHNAIPEIIFINLQASTPVASYCDIPVLLKSCKTCYFLYDLRFEECPKCPGLHLETILRGAIRFYSRLDAGRLRSKIAEANIGAKVGSPDDELWFAKEISHLYASQAAPGCFLRPEKRKKRGFCAQCNFSHTCHTGFSVAGKKDSLDLDEVLHQLQEDCRQIMGENQFFSLIYDATQKIIDGGIGGKVIGILKYKAVKYIPMPKDYAAKLATTDQAKVEDAAEKADATYKTHWKPLVSKIFQTIDDAPECQKVCHDLLEQVIQITNAGFTNRIWNLWENSLFVVRAGSVTKGPMNPLDEVRDFIEWLFFNVNQDTGFLVAPLAYLGQKLGVIFIRMQKDSGLNTESLKEKLRGKEPTFLRLAREFAPLLFHSLQYKVYKEAVGELEDKSLEEVPDILLNAFPNIMNMMAGIFWSRRQIESASPQPPQVISFPRVGENLRKLTLQPEDYVKNTLIPSPVWDQAFGAVKDKYRDWSRRKLEVIPFDSILLQANPIYQKIKSRLLLPVPLGKSDSSTLGEELQGVFDLYFDMDVKTLRRHAHGLARELGFIFTQTAHAAKQKQQVLLGGTRAAVAAIMSRNMSHNIGSHVLSYWHGILKRSAGNEHLSESADLFNYIKERMDFIAEIATMSPSWTSNFSLCRDVVIPFIQQRALLNNICLSDKFHFDECDSLGCISEHQKFSFELIVDNQPPLLKIRGGPFGGPLYNDVYLDPEKVPLENDPVVAIPHGAIGMHAFYIILENFIRNSAKHAGARLQQDFTIKLNVKTLELGSEFKDIILLDISDDLGNCAKPVFEKLFSGLEDDLIDSKGEIKPGSWGLKEMRICANFLRMGGPGDIGEKYYFPPYWSKECNQKKLLSVSCENTICQSQPQNYKCGQPNISYRLYLVRPKEALVIGNNLPKLLTSEISENLEHKGINIDSEIRTQSIKKGIPHRFLSTVGSAEIGSNYLEDERYSRVLPYRIAKCEEDTIIEGNDEAIIRELYEDWIKKAFDVLPSVSVFDGEVPNDLIDNGKGSEKLNIYDERPPQLFKGVVFDRHGDWLKQYEINELPECTCYYPYKRDSSIARLLLNLPKEGSRWRLKFWELLECSLTRVLIADERIAKKNCLRTVDIETNPLAIEVFTHMGVYLMPEETFSKEHFRVKLEEYITRYKPFFTVIHKGLLDKLELPWRAEEGLVRELCKSTNIILTSGRGSPRLPAGARFVSLSNLEKSITEVDKFGLVQMLFSLRRPKNDLSNE